MKLFNKQRYALQTGTRIKRYLIYAIGEIVLVVIGILIALWINNWNQEKKIAETNKTLQEQVLAQLQRDISDIQRFRRDLDTLNNVYLKSLNLPYDITKAEKKNVFSVILFDVEELGLDTHNVNLIDNADLDNSEISQTIIDLNGTYKLYLKNISDIENIIYDKTTRNLEIIESTQDWYTNLITLFKCNQDCLTYLTKDEKQLARIASLRFLYNNAYAETAKGFEYDLIRKQKELMELVGVVK